MRTTRRSPVRLIASGAPHSSPTGFAFAVIAADDPGQSLPSGTPGALAPGAGSVLIDHLRHPAALADGHGMLQLVSAAFTRRYGSPAVALVGRALEGLIPEPLRPALAELLAGARPALNLPFAAGSLPLRLTGLPGSTAAGAALLVELPDSRQEPRSLEALVVEHGGPLALLHLQLQQLDLVQGTLGLEAGDSLLESLAERLSAALPPEAIFCREGGDRFLVVLPGQWQEEALLHRLDDLLVAIEQPLTLMEHVVEPAFHVGAARSPEDGSEFHRLRQAATQALQETHRPPVRACRLAQPPEHTVQIKERLALPLASALERGGLELAFQPIMALDGRRLVGAEVLCRWEDPVLGRQSPRDFINVAEATQQISTLGRWVVDTALATLAAWDQAGHRLSSLGFNLSALQVENSDDMAFLTQALARHGLHNSRVVLEIAEADLLPMRERAVLRLTELQRQGFRLAMDDFGTGYAGLQRLDRLPLSQVKVDRSLIAAIDYDPMQQAMMTALVAAAKAGGFELVAEGIERSRQLQMLQILGCGYGQGFHLSPPLTPGEMERALTEHRGVSSGGSPVQAREH